MTDSENKKYDKILDYLGIITTNLNAFKESTEKRFDAIDEDMATLKGTTRRIEERQKLLELSLAILQQADRNRQDDIDQITIRIERLKDQIRNQSTPPAP